jgi:putative methionine-R-sulfoxide reductase with GAF domain
MTDDIENPTIFVACRMADKYKEINECIKGLIKEAGMIVSEKMAEQGVIPIAMKETINVLNAQGFCVIFIPEDGKLTTEHVLHEMFTAKNFQIPAFMFVERSEFNNQILEDLRKHQAELNCVGEWCEFKRSNLSSRTERERILRYLHQVKRFVIKEYSKISDKVELAVAALSAQLPDMEPFHSGLMEISEAYNKEPAILYNAAAKSAAEVTGAEFGFIGMLEPRGDWVEVVITGFYGSSKTKSEKILKDLQSYKLGYNFKGETFGLTGHVAKMGTPLCEKHIQRDIEKFKEEKKNFIDPGNIKIQSELCVPISLKGRTIGIIDVESIFENRFDKVHQMILNWLSMMLALAYSGEQLESFIGDLSKPLSKKERAGRILNTLMNWSQADSGFIAILKKGNCCVEAMQGIGLVDEIKKSYKKGNLEIEPNKGLAGKVLSSGKAIYFEEAEREEGYLKWFNPVSSEIVLPIISENGNTIGVVDLEFTLRQQFEDIDKKLFENIANLLAIFFEEDI